MNVIQDEREDLLSASGFDRVHGPEGCPASFMLEKHIADSGDRTAANRGTRIHSALEGTIPMANLAHSDRICAERIAFEEGRLVEELGFEGATQIKEQRFWVTDKNKKKLFSGKPDVIHVLSDRALCLNYKTGFYLPTPIQQNKQMKAEAILTAFSGNFLFKTISTALIHPNAPLEDGGISQHAQWPIEQIKMDLEAFSATARNVLKPDAPFRPSESNCKFCRGKKTGACHAYLEWSSKR
jgi:hypothetical protein